MTCNDMGAQLEKVCEIASWVFEINNQKVVMIYIYIYMVM
jgi:hypothetical protein